MALNIKDAGLKFIYPLRKMSEITTITIHHDNNHNLNNPYSIHRYHQSKGWSGIGYNYIVYADGDVYKGRGIHRGAHCSGANGYSLGICISGDFHGADADTVTAEQMYSSVTLIKWLLDKYPTIKTIKPHRDMPRASTVCPGNKFPYAKLIQRVHEDEPSQYKRALRLKKPYMRGNDIRDLQNKLNKLGHKCGIADGIFGDKTRLGVKSYQSFIYPHNGVVNKPLWDNLFD